MQIHTNPLTAIQEALIQLRSDWNEDDLDFLNRISFSETYVISQDGLCIKLEVTYSDELITKTSSVFFKEPE
jgi:galactose mutarotase-like enzyme